ncbi:protein kinase [Streptomyces sp. N2-109]|uniref:non-specific serine/threonine protein kinase n=1 Tax=Streptomyces gossypii TaxID=2883101 RepID=A0ABT2JSL5_9ACTN|nr:serine/threonine-protein kinase [Streptomyces gossypii]MCT2590870.1 protein kinase [Streptomyces gossypii]
MGRRAVPQRIAGRYELISLISSGGMGQVWRGYDTVLDRDIAVKLIKPEIAESADRAEFLARFRREARVTAKIEHHGVPSVFDASFDEEADRLYLVMQLVRGLSLADLLAEHADPLPVSWAVSIAAQICTVLSYAHAVPVVHRDIKPENVMVDRAGSVKVLDFGIASVLGTDVTRLTATGRVLGTRPYMSPEQIRNVPVSPRSDLYALGCLLHELLAGERVFDAVDEIPLMYQHLSEPPVPLRKLRPDVPTALELLVLELLAKEAADRPVDAWTVYERLAPLLPPPDTGASPDLAPPPTGVPDPTRPYRRPAAPRPRPVATGGPTGPAPAPEAPSPVDPSTPAGSDSVGGTVAEQEIDEAVDHALALLDEDRFSQAADVLAEVIALAPAGQGADSPKLLELRLTHAVALFLGGDFRRALPELRTLADTLSRLHGPSDGRAIDCRKQAAYCHAELGQFEEALHEMENLRPHAAALFGDRSEELFALRLDHARFQVAAGRDGTAARTLRLLHSEAAAALGRAHPLVTDVAAILARIRFQDGRTT